MKFRVAFREPVNGMTHLVGAVLSVVGLVVLLGLIVLIFAAAWIYARSQTGASASATDEAAKRLLSQGDEEEEGEEVEEREEGEEREEREEGEVSR